MQIALLTLLGAIIGVASAHIAAHRSAAQPTGAYPAAEADLIGAVLADPSVFRTVVAIEPDDFVWAPHQRLWAALFELSVDDTDADNVAEADAAGLPSLQLPFTAAELVARLERDGLLTNIHPTAAAAQALPKKRLHAAGSQVLGGAEDRNLTGGSEIVEGSSVNEPLQRVLVRPSINRVVAAAAGAAAAMGLVAASGVSAVVLAAAAVLTAGSVICAFVDLDTLYVDRITVGAMMVAGTALAAVAAGSDLSTNATRAAATTIAIVGSLELVAFIWSRVRGRIGLGGGDSMLLIPLLVVPVLSTGIVETALWGLISALVLTIVGQGALMATGRATRDTQFPWVPYLVAGWPIGWYLAATFGSF